MLLGDAPPHKKYLKSIETLIKKDTRRGFLFYAVKIRSRYRSKRPNYDPQLKGFDRIAELGGGKSFWVDFATLAREHSSWGVARPRGDASPGRMILREILKAAMAKGYEDRVNTFVDVLEQYVEGPRPPRRDPQG